MVSPALEQLAREKAGQIKLVKVDIDRAPKLAQRFTVQAVPTLMVLYRGEVIARQPGAAPLNILRSWLDDAIARIPSESDLEAH
jgi:thioredoxin 2